MKVKRYLSFVLSAVMAFTAAASCPVLADETDQKEIAYAENEEYTESLEDVLGELPENDELLEGYLNELFYGSYGTTILGDYAEGNLEGNDAAAYRILKDKIEKIASGEISDTKLLVPFETLGVPSDGYSASDLGVSSIIENGAISQAAQEALMEKVHIDLRKVLNYLLVDCPYAFYWFDKTEGVSGEGYRMSAAHNGTEYKLTLTGDGITYFFPVAEEYQDKDASDSLYTVKNTLVQTAKTASDNAKAIVKKYEGFSDYDKLDNYRKEICEMVSYNTSAAEEVTTPYGNPWQLIWVFDGDDGTDVVCEGYSKAFQYLCDMSDFFNPDIRCYTVTGDMIGGTGAGAHMWNIVTMSDKKNYIVDVTNCDGGSIGAPDKLFLAGGEYKAITDDQGVGYGNGYEVEIPEQKPIKYVYDEQTSDLYADSILQIADSKFAFNYKASGRFDSGIAWTLDQDGFLNIRGTGDMPVPEDVTDTKNAPWSVYNAEVERVVVEEGITSVSNWAFAYFDKISEISLPEGLREIGMTAFAGSQIKKLKLPESITRIDPLAFAYCRSLTEIEIPKNVTMIGPGAFLGCSSLTTFTVNPENQSFVFENGILYNKNKTEVIFGLEKTGGEIILPDTVTVINPYAFMDCSNLVSVTIPDSVTNIQEEAFKGCTSLREVSFLGDCPDFTDTEAGEDYEASSVFAGDDLTIYYLSSKEASWAQRKESGFAGAKNIVFRAACDVHVWAEEYTVDKEATCTEPGLKSKHCTVCGKSGETETIPADHNYGGWTVAKQPTCTESGTEKRICGTCQKEDTRDIDPTGHNWNSDDTIDLQPTCTNPGSKSKHCAVCGEKDPATVTAVPATGHTLNKQTSENGSYYICSVCGKTFSDGEGKTEITVQGTESKTLVQSISISAISVKIAAGKKVALQTEVLPANASDKKLTWESGNSSYATVDAAGVVTTKKAGAGKSVTITAKAADGSGKSASITIKLMKDVVKKVKIKNAQKRLKAGRSMKLKAQVTGSGKKINKTIKWTSSNEKYAMVSSKGVVKALSAGKGKTVKITAKATDGSKKKATVKIKIN